jgi:RND family efflux transporter MFP subunit
MAKESQFLLGVRTIPVRREEVRRRLTVLGRVAPRGGSEVEIIAPQSGRVQFPGGRPPVLGQSVRREQILGNLVVVDDLGLRAPISGVITGVFAVSGQLVQAGQKIITMLDPSVVWVHADVFEADQASVQRSTRAIVTSRAMPDVALPGRRVAMGVTVGEVQGAVEAWFEVPNPGGRLKVGALVDVGIEIGGAEPSLVVPLSAVFEKDGRKLVFVHTAPERFAAREVRIVTSLGERAAVEGELAPGDRVVTTAGYQLLSSPAVGLNR